MAAYSKEELYKIATVALRHHRDESSDTAFWNRMVRQYGASFFGDRTAGALRAKWRALVTQVICLHKSQYGAHLRGYHKNLARAIGREKAQKIQQEARIRDAASDTEDESPEVIAIDSQDDNDLDPPADEDEDDETGSEPVASSTSAVLSGCRATSEAPTSTSPVAPDSVPGSDPVSGPPEKRRAGEKLRLRVPPPSPLPFPTDRMRTAYNLSALLNISSIRAVSPDCTRVANLCEVADLCSLDPAKVSQEIATASFFLVMRKPGDIRLLDVRQLEGYPVNDPSFKLTGKIQELSNKYGRTYTEVQELFEQSSGSLLRVEQHLRGECVMLWEPLEDMALKHPENAVMFQCLREHKGDEEISRRKLFLRSLFHPLT